MHQAKRYAPIFLTFIIGVALSITLYKATNNWELQNQQVRFSNHATLYSNTIKSVIHDHIGTINLISDCVRSNPGLSRSRFSTLVRNTLERYPGIQGFSWNPVIDHSERDYYEMLASRELSRDFIFTERSSDGLIPASERDEYVIVYYIEPYQGNEAALGYDIASETIRKQSTERAFLSGKLTATATIKLVQESEQQAGVLILLPIYHLDQPIETVEQRHAARRGVLVEVLRIGHIVDLALAPLTAIDGQLYLYDITNGDEHNLLHFIPATSAANSQPRDYQTLTQNFQWQQRFSVAGRTWELLFVPSASALEQTPSWQAYGVLITSLLLTVILIVHLTNRLHYTRDIEKSIKIQGETNQKLAEEVSRHKTTLDLLGREFSRAERYLETVEAVIIALDPDGNITLINRRGCELIGLSEDELIGMNWFDNFLPQPEGHEVIYEIFKKIISGVLDEVTYNENHIVTSSGERRLIAWHNSFDHDEQGNIVGSLSAGIDITERNRAEALTEELLQQNRGLTDKMFTIQEEERRHLAHELHDELGQLLTAIHLNARTIHTSTDFDDIQRSASIIDENAKVMHHSIRSLANQLRPSLLEHFGLAESLKGLIEQIEASHPHISYRIEINTPIDDFNETLAITLYRIVQEGVVNATRHANANNILVSINSVQNERDEPRVVLSIEDDGEGLKSDLLGDGFGLPGIRERTRAIGGDFKLDSSPLGGLRIEVTLPTG